MPQAILQFENMNSGVVETEEPRRPLLEAGGTVVERGQGLSMVLLSSPHLSQAHLPVQQTRFSDWPGPDRVLKPLQKALTLSLTLLAGCLGSLEEP